MKYQLIKQCLRLFGVLFNCKCTVKTQYHSIESFHSNISCGDFSMLECYFHLKFIEQIIVSHLFCLKSMTLIQTSSNYILYNHSYYSMYSLSLRNFCKHFAITLARMNNLFLQILLHSI